jgi:hypothetical protein
MYIADSADGVIKVDQGRALTRVSVIEAITRQVGAAVLLHAEYIVELLDVRIQKTAIMRHVRQLEAPFPASGQALAPMQRQAPGFSVEMQAFVTIAGAGEMIGNLQMNRQGRFLRAENARLPQRREPVYLYQRALVKAVKRSWRRGNCFGPGQAARQGRHAQKQGGAEEIGVTQGERRSVFWLVLCWPPMLPYFDHFSIYYFVFPRGLALYPGLVKAPDEAVDFKP